MHSKRQVSGAILLLLIALFALALIDETPLKTGTVQFKHENNTLIGELILPNGPGPHPLVIFVHGDGAMPRDGLGYYRPMQKVLAEHGFASFSWDKPGVGESTGEWESQTMLQRAGEVVAAAAHLRQSKDIRADAIGLWGISQGAWVMPLAILQDPQLAWMISVSGAVNWDTQSDYFMQNRLQLAGADAREIRQARLWEKTISAMLKNGTSYNDYLEHLKNAPPCCQNAMPESRWHFAQLNIASDIRNSLPQVHVPVLAIFGEHDLNVNVQESMKVYDEMLHQANNSQVAIKIFSGADHGLIQSNAPVLLNADLSFFNLWRLLRIEFMQEEAFVPGYFELMMNWLEVCTAHPGSSPRR